MKLHDFQSRQFGVGTSVSRGDHGPAKKFFVWWLAGFVSLSLLGVSAPVLGHQPESCIEVGALDVRGSITSYRGSAGPGDEHCWMVEAEAGTEWRISVHLPSLSSAEPALLLDGTGARAIGLGSTTQLYRIDISGTFVIRLVNQDPNVSLGNYRVDISLEGTQEQEIEPDLTHDPCLSGNDDHGDDFLCSTWLHPNQGQGGSGQNDTAQIHREQSGVLENPWGDDVDVFRFRLDEPRLVVIESLGATDTVGALEDHQGYRLALDREGGESQNFRLARRLVPGLYFVRVAGEHSAQGPYLLRLATENW